MRSDGGGGSEYFLKVEFFRRRTLGWVYSRFKCGGTYRSNDGIFKENKSCNLRPISQQIWRTWFSNRIECLTSMILLMVKRKKEQEGRQPVRRWRPTWVVQICTDHFYNQMVENIHDHE